MPLPDLTHLQFLLLAALLNGEQPGRALRELLGNEGHKKSAPAFYQLMARLEDAKFVSGRYEQKTVLDQTVKERVYKLTGAGSAAYAQVQEFYAGIANGRLGLGGVGNA